MKMGDLKSFESFNKFFTRELKEGVRKINDAEDITSMCSPCDGRVLTCGEISTVDATIDCVKGRSYRLDEFMLGVRDENDKAIPALIKRVLDRGNKLFYMVIYLAPSDYHRFHSPTVYNAEQRRHIAGYLDPVKPAYVNKHKDVFKNNERVNIFGNWSQGFFLQSFVGALNVGSIKLHFDNDVKTNQSSPQEPYLYDKAYKKQSKMFGPLDKYLFANQEVLNKDEAVKARSAEEPMATSDSGINILKGEELGWFEMGSTIVLVFEGPQDTVLHV